MENIKQKTKYGIFWNGLERIAIQGSSFVLSLILSRLLTPQDYGTIGMLAIFLTLSNVFVDSGFSRALIQKQDRTEFDYSTVLIFNITVSCILYVILFFGSPLISRFYKIPELVSLQRVFFIIIVLNSFKVVQSAQFQIKLDFKNIALINTISVIVSGVIAVFIAYKGFGVWTLVIQQLLYAFISTVLFWITGKWIPKTGFSKESFKKLFGFGSKLLVSALLSTTLNNIHNLVIGKKYNPESLGLYTRAKHFPELVSSTCRSVLNNTTFPMMSELQSEQDVLIKIFSRLIKMSALVIFPAMVGMSVLSKQIILVLLGEKWLFAADLLFWLALAEVFFPLDALNLNLLNAIGRSDLFLKVDMSKIPIVILMMVITFPISLKAVVVGKTVAAFIYFYINAFMIGRLYNFGAFKQLAHCWKIIVATIVMGMTVAFGTCFFKNNLLSLVSGIIIGIAVYILMLVLLKEGELSFMINKIFKRRKYMMLENKE